MTLSVQTSSLEVVIDEVEVEDDGPDLILVIDVTPGQVGCNSSNAHLFDPQNQRELRQAKSICMTACSATQRAECQKMAEHGTDKEEGVGWNENTGVFGGKFYRYGWEEPKPRFRKTSF